MTQPGQVQQGAASWAPPELGPQSSGGLGTTDGFSHNSLGSWSVLHQEILESGTGTDRVAWSLMGRAGLPGRLCAPPGPGPLPSLGWSAALWRQRGSVRAPF